MNDQQQRPEDAVQLYQCAIDVRWGDMDAMGHVNNTGYFRFCEQTRMEWFSSLDTSGFELPDSQIVIINAWCEFRVPIVYPASLLVSMSAGKPGNSSFMSYYQISDRNSDGSAGTKIYAAANAKVVWVDRAGTSSTAMPGSIRQLLQASL